MNSLDNLNSKNQSIPNIHLKSRKFSIKNYYKFDAITKIFVQKLIHYYDQISEILLLLLLLNLNILNSFRIIT